MIKDVKIGSEYYMCFVSENDKGMILVKIIRHLPKPNSLFYEAAVKSSLFNNTGQIFKEIVTNAADLFPDFNSALDHFKKNSSFNEQDMIVDTFDDLGWARQFKRGKK